MYALVPAPIPPAVDSKLTPHVDTQGTSRMSIFACIYHRGAFSSFKTKRKAPFSPAHKSFFVFGTWHVGHQDLEYPHEKVHDSTSRQASFEKCLSWDFVFSLSSSGPWSWSNSCWLNSENCWPGICLGRSLELSIVKKKVGQSLWIAHNVTIHIESHIVFWKKSSQLLRSV